MLAVIIGFYSWRSGKEPRSSFMLIVHGCAAPFLRLSARQQLLLAIVIV
jgi:hypothetical protein